jgi:hypothetical protein
MNMTGITSLIPILFWIAVWGAIIVALIRLLNRKKKVSVDKLRYDLAMSFASAKFNDDLRIGEIAKEDETDVLLKHFEYAYDRYSNLTDEYISVMAKTDKNKSK